MNFGILEIGSTNTKAYVYKNNKLIDYGSKYIPFKNNYKLSKSLNEHDIQELINFARQIKKETEKLYAFGTSIFRNLNEKELTKFSNILKQELDIVFKVVSADEENEYTVKGVLSNNSYRGNMIVVIGGGGSTEIALVKRRKIVAKVNLPFGAMDITDQFPELKDDIVKTNFNEVLEYTQKLTGNLDFHANTMVLAGGDYIYFYEKANYQMSKNNLFVDSNIPYLLSFSKADYYDHDILTKSLNEIKTRCSDNVGWWDGARGMRFCINSIARETKVKYILPTKINMIIGLADKLIKENS